MKLGALVLVWLAGLVLVSSGCKSKEVSADPARQQAASVAAYKVEGHTFIRMVEFPATVLAQKQVTLMAKVPGDVQKIHASEGDEVKKGEKLVQLGQRDFALALRQAQAQYAAAKAGAQAAEIGLEALDTKHRRFSALRDEDAIAQNDFEDIDSARRITRAKLKAAQAQLALGQVGIDAAKTNLSYTIIRAPFDGVVGKRMIDEGARVMMMPPSPLMVFLDISSVKVAGGVTERDLPLVQKGAPAKVYVDALRPEPFEAPVDRVEPLVDPKTRTVTVQVAVPNDESLLKAGMSARVVVEHKSQDAPAVPDGAVIRAEVGTGRGIVFVIRDGKAHRQDVTFGARDEGLLEITKGLEGGETIVRSGQDRLRDGQPVSVTKPEPKGDAS